MQRDLSGMKNFGYFIVPFSVGRNNRHSFKEYLTSNESFTENNSFLKSKYLFKHINNSFFCDSTESKIYDVDLSIAKDVKLYKNAYATDKVVAEIEHLNIIMFSDYIGFLLIKIDYLDMTPMEISNFVFSQKRTKVFDRNTNGYKNNLLHDMIFSLLPPELCDAFFYSNDENYQFCDIFQFVMTQHSDMKNGNDYDKYYDDVLFCLGRGYNNRFNYDKDALNKSSTDMHYSPFVYYDWCGSQSALSCIVNVEKAEDGDLAFLKAQFIENFNNDYLFEYLVLLNQKYTTMYLLYRLTQDNINIEHIEEELNEFKIKYSVKAISNELTYQNLYNQMYDALDINSLIRDVEDASQRIKSNERKKDEEREKNTNIMLSILSILTIGSALTDISQYLKEFNIENTNQISLIIVIIVLIIIVLVLFGSLIKRKCKERKK